jgi:hypothetical protein
MVATQATGVHTSRAVDPETGEIAFFAELLTAVRKAGNGPPDDELYLTASVSLALVGRQP